MKKIADYLIENSRKYQRKMAYMAEERGLTWKETADISLSLAEKLRKRYESTEKRPVALFLSKSPEAVAALFAVCLTGRPYVFLDPDLPTERREEMLLKLQPELLIDTAALNELLEEKAEWTEGFSETDIHPEDSLYICFTSSTTGVPKGVEASYASVFNYVSGLLSSLPFTEDTVTANQAPFYFDACLKDIFTALFTGGSSFLLPKESFLNPQALIESLEKHGVNALTWTASAYSLIEAFRPSLPSRFLSEVKFITFGSEVMKIKTLNYLRENFKKARVFQLYGTTETTGMTAFYEVKRDFSEGEKIPLGRAFPGTSLTLREGEILISGKGVTKGYYGDPERTKEVFIEKEGKRCYRTGDLGGFNEAGELCFLGRKSRIIKRAGYMLSLDEMEDRTARIEGVSGAACLYDETKDKVLLYYEGWTDKERVREELKRLLPKAALPSAIKKKDRLPKLPNGKTAYEKLKEEDEKNGTAYGNPDRD